MLSWVEHEKYFITSRPDETGLGRGCPHMTEDTFSHGEVQITKVLVRMCGYACVCDNYRQHKPQKTPLYWHSYQCGESTWPND